MAESSLEYKNPHTHDQIGLKLESHGTKEIIKQIKQRFDDFASEEHLSHNRIFACGLDGRNIIYLRHRGKEFEVENPQPITPLTIERLLRALVSLGATGKSFTPENLERDFGSNAPTAQTAIKALYSAICTTKNSKANTFFDEWKILYGEVCGYDVNKVNDKVSQLAKHYGIGSPNAAELLFSIHTYYSVIIKFLASEIVANFAGFATSIVKKCVSAPSSSALKREAQALEDGGVWKSWGINNFLEGDLFAWYVAAWDDNVNNAVRAVALEIDAYDPSTLSIDPSESRDLLKKLYQHLFPQSVRHDLGEYYTPDWLAEMTLDRIGYVGDPQKRILDPACGSGTFLVAAINRIREWFETNRYSCGFDEKTLVELLLSNVVGFELNPLAVMAARTNYLLAIRNLIKLLPAIELPIYLCDSVMTPSEYGELFAKVKRLKTSVGEFVIPAEISTSIHNLAIFAEIIEQSIADKYDVNEFIQLCKDQGLNVEEEELHKELYQKIFTLEKQNKNGIWARIIKNSFAPLFTARFDFIVGNPPWINWESLPRDYRESLIPIWKRYELFSLSGSAGRLGGGKKDMSMLFVYVSVDKYLNDDCRLGFVITQSVFKTKGAGDGFRRLRYEDGATRYWVAPVRIDDLSDIQIFDGATNRTALAIFEKKKNKFNYPVEYSIWRGPSRIKQDTSLKEVLSKVTEIDAAAVPVNPSASRSPWLTIPKAALPACRKIIGVTRYSAQAGCTTWLNGVYWIKVLDQKPGGLLFVENLHDIGKKPVKHCKITIEDEFVFPLLRGEDVHRWNAKPSLKIIVPQDPATRKGVAVSTLKAKARRNL